MTFSEGRLSHIAQVIFKTLTRERLLTVRNERVFLNTVKTALTDTLSLDDRIDAAIRTRMPRQVLPGSREWDVLYRKLYDEERRKLGER